jgi:hypothetical protein
MKKKITFILGLLFLNILFAQEADFKWATPEKMSRKSASPDLLGVRGDKAFILKSDNPTKLGSYYIVSQDVNTLEPNDKIIFEKIMPKEVKDNELYGAYLLKEKIVIVSFTKKKELIGSIVDLTGKVEKGKLTIDRADSKDKEFDGFEVVVSPNQSIILGYRKTKGADKKATSFVFSTYNDELKKLNSAKIQLPYDEDNIEFGKVSIDNNSNVYIVANATIQGKRKKFDIIKSILLHLPMATPKPEINEVPLPLEKRLATSMSFLTFDDKIAITGMYASNKDAEFLEGVFYTEINKSSLEVINSSYEKFKPGAQTRKRTGGAKMDNNVGFGYKLKEIFIEDQNSKLLIFENTSTRYASDSRGNVTKMVFSQDILTVKLSSENKLEWNTVIYKDQFMNIPYSRVAGGIGPLAISINVYRTYKKFEDMLGYTTLYKNGNLYFIFNDHTDNMNRKNADKRFNSFKKSYSAIVKLNVKNGKWDKKALFTNKESKRILTPANSEQIAQDKIMVFAFDKKKTNIGIITID